MKPANTPAHVNQMMAMPPRRFIVRTTPAGVRYFLYADPGDCKCVFVGDEKARQNYRSIASARLPQPDNVGPSGTSTSRAWTAIWTATSTARRSGVDLFSYPF
jgi:hypothetical protein